jgi:hypothetical protein
MSEETSKFDPYSQQRRRFWVIWGLLYFGWGLVLAYACSDGHSHKLVLSVGMGIIGAGAVRLSAWAVSIPNTELLRLPRWRKGGRVDLPSRVR